MAVRVWKLFAVHGGFANAPGEVSEELYFVAADTRRRAYYLAYAGIWALGVANPAGIVQVVAGDRAVAAWSWCGCVLSSPLDIAHGDGARILTEVMRHHLLDASHGSATTRVPRTG